MMNKEFLRKVAGLKKQTFTNYKIAETLSVSVSTVKRALRLINKGALIPPLHKFFLTGDWYFMAVEWEELAAKITGRMTHNLWVRGHILRINVTLTPRKA